jgi:hypothetical protein
MKLKKSLKEKSLNKSEEEFIELIKLAAKLTLLEDKKLLEELAKV